MVDLAHAADRHVGGYSLGMRQRLGLAAALLGNATGTDPEYVAVPHVP
jgi:ABC-type multidrug transport system ATPase subunit